MACLPEKLFVSGALVGLAGSGVVVIVGAPTVVLSAAGGAAAVAAFIGVIASLIALKECYERHGKTADADKLARKVDQLQAQLSDLRAQFGLT
jgi:hypothetical protein